MQHSVWLHISSDQDELGRLAQATLFEDQDNRAQPLTHHKYVVI